MITRPRPGPRHIGYVALSTSRDTEGIVWLAFTTSQLWTGPKPSGVYGVDRDAAAGMGQSGPSRSTFDVWQTFRSRRSGFPILRPRLTGSWDERQRGSDSSMRPRSLSLHVAIPRISSALVPACRTAKLTTTWQVWSGSVGTSAPILALDAVGPSFPTILTKSSG